MVSHTTRRGRLTWVNTPSCSSGSMLPRKTNSAERNEAAVSPKGVKMESSATLPTTSRLIESHPVGGGDAQQSEGVGEDDARRAGEQQSRLLGGRAFRRADGAGVVVPAVHDG